MAYLEEVLSEFRKGAKIKYSDWDKDLYIYMKNNCVYSSDMSKHLDYDILSDKWELYQEPEPDWDVIIRNKCLCWFWNNPEGKKTLNYLREKSFEKDIFIDGNFVRYKNCRPVRKDEINFYIRG